jgi:hypothetical protein
VVGKKAKINFEILPGKYGQFVILDLESEKTISCKRARPQKARFLFLATNLLGGEIINIRVLGL